MMKNQGQTARLMIVDDDGLLRGMAAKTLRHAGFEVDEAVDGEEGLSRFETGTYDLVLLDVMLPGLDGFEVCQRIRELPNGAALPILMLTGLNDTSSIEQAYAQGATDFITKPINWTLLSHRVRYSLRASLTAEAIRRSRESLARAQRLAGMGNWEFRADGRIICSAEMARLFGADAEVEAVAHRSAQEFLSHVAQEDRERVRQARECLLRDGTPYRLEFQIVRLDGATRTVFEQATPVVDERGKRIGVDGITQDITERVQAQERIRQLAHYDGTTGLPNRQFFAALAAPPLALARRQGTRCALLHLDLDRFKRVNDTFGRSSGDAVLQTVAERLRSCVRGGDLASVNTAAVEQGLLARVGGNSFTIMLTALRNEEQAATVAQRLLAAIAEPIEVGTHSVVLTASAGIALFPGDAEDLPGLTRAAEQAVYTAKGAGRAQHRFFDEHMNAHASGRLLLEVELRRAIANGELTLHFQPKIDARGGQIVGAEALVRWQHPQRGLVPPGEFIPLAEDTGLILPLTDWVFESACRSLRAWRDAGLPEVPLSVNLAAASLTDMSLVAKLDAVTQQFGVSPTSLTLEVTETMLMRDVNAGVTLLEALRARGYGLSLDDFGIGFSSLSYLKRLPMDELKIDRAFVTDATRSGRDAALVMAIVALGQGFGLRLVGEGVETKEQMAFLLHAGCSVQQGYLFSRPVPAAAFEQLLLKGLTAGPTGGTELSPGAALAGLTTTV